jgi:TolB-like protein
MELHYMRFSFLLYLVLLSVTLSFAQNPRENIALSDLSAQGVDASASAIISDRLRNELFNTGLFTVIERGQMQEILKEQGFQQSGCTSDQCAIEVGQILNVKYIVVGSVGLLGRIYTLSTRVIDVASGKVIATATVDCRCEIEDLLSNSTAELARRLG